MIHRTNRLIKRVLVTGAGGYIGSVLCDLLHQLKYEISPYDTNYFSEDVFYEKDLGPINKMDVRGMSPYEFKDIDAVIHLAGLSNDPMGQLDENLTDWINHQASVELAKMAKDAGVKRFLFSSSCSVYGSNDDIVSESFKTNPLTAYAKSKVDAEKAILDLVAPNFSPIILRNATVYGLSPMFRTDLVVNNLTASAFINGEIRLNSQGNAFRPLIEVRDVASAFITLMQVPKSKIHGEVFNIGSNYQNYRIIDLANLIAKLSLKKVVIADGAEPDQRNYNVNFTKFASYFPDFIFTGSVERTVQDLLAFFSATNFKQSNMEQLTRLNTIKYLMESNKLDKNLFWSNL